MGNHCKDISTGWGVGADVSSSPKVRFVLVTNGWRKLDLNTSALEGGHTPQPLRYLALGEQGAGFCWGVSF